MTNAICSVPICDRDTDSRGLCNAHYQRLLKHGDPGTEAIKGRLTVEERFWAKVNKTDTCWLWTARILPHGYAVFYVNGLYLYAHRWSYEHHVGPIPDGLTIDHVANRGCTNRHCVNPAHLEAVTQQVNTARSTNFTAQQAKQTQCIHGHRFTSENTYIHDGHRYCRTCRAERKGATDDATPQPEHGVAAV